VKVQINGVASEVPDGTTLAALVTPAPGLAAAVNGDVVRGWDQVVLVEGDAVEVLTAMQGG
jgi:thiamine biosynthesis protein ThiS